MFDSYCITHPVISGLPAANYEALIKKYLESLGIKENLLSAKKGITICRKRYNHSLVDIKKAICVIFYDNLGLCDFETSKITGMERTTVLHHRHTGYDLFHVKDENFMPYYNKLIGLL